MNVPLAAVRTASAADPSSRPPAPLQGTALLLLRGLWLLSFGTVLIIFVAGISAYFAYLHRISSGGVDIDAGQLTPGGLRNLQALGLSVDVYAAYLVGIKVLFISVWLTVAAVIFWRKSDDRMALFASFTLVTFSVGFGFWIEAVLPAWTLPLQFVNFLSGRCISLFVWVFPDGRFVPRWARWPIISITVLHGVYSAFLAAPLAGFTLLSTLDGLVFLGVLISVVAVQIYRYRRVSTALQRQQTKWAVFGFALAIMGFVIVIVLGTQLPASYLPGTLFYLGMNTLLYGFLLGIPLSLGLAILHSRLWDIDLIINRTLVYGALTAGVIGLYIVVVGYLGAVFRTAGNEAISLVAAGVVAVLFQPGRALLQRGANRLLYGQRDEPYMVVTRLSRRLEGTLAPEAVLPAIVETVAQALKLPYAAILWQQGEALELAASYGRPAGAPVALPLVYQAETIGQLQLAPRAPGEAFTPADVRLLDELARQASLAVHAVRLASDLQKARERLVLAREEERRRLRRDLHDGVGPTLASLAQRIDTAGHLVPHDPEAAVALLANLKTQVKATIADVRRVVYALRPPVLDELGLVSAIREHALQLQETHGLDVTVEAPADLPPLPAAVEVAAYRIALEALTNVGRHAQARHCRVRLDLADRGWLCLAISDDGRGLPADYRAGVGITAMRERAAELGGACTITGRPGTTCVTIRLPLLGPQQSDAPSPIRDGSVSDHPGED